MTESAEKRITALAKQLGITDPCLRISVRGGGCSGLTYEMWVDSVIDTSSDGSLTTRSPGPVPIVVDKKSYLFLSGCTVDYVETMMRSGFDVKNPNATRTCGCGESFSV